MKTISYIKKILGNLFLLLFVFLSFKTGSGSKPQNIDIRIKEMKDLNYKDKIPTDSALKIVLGCYNDSKKIEYKKGILDSGIFLTVLYVNKLDFANRIKISNEMESLMNDNKDYRNVAEFYNSRAYSFTCLGLHRDAYKEYLKALKIVKKISIMMIGNTCHP